jgi:MinD superfamily P-loop ATPase
VWPRSRYIARFDAEACTACGICVERCHFHAFTIEEKGEITFYPDRCWGCGLCAHTCPENAIHMQPLEEGDEGS